MNSQQGMIHKMLNQVYSELCTGSMAATRERILRVQIALRTGLNLSKYGPTTIDSDADINKVLEVIKSREIGLVNFKLK